MYSSAHLHLSRGAQTRALSINWQKLRNACLTPLTTSNLAQSESERTGRWRTEKNVWQQQTNHQKHKYLHTDGLLHGKQMPVSHHTASKNTASPKMWNKCLYHTARSLCRQEMSPSVSGWEWDGAKWIRRDTSPERSLHRRLCVCVGGVSRGSGKVMTWLAAQVHSSTPLRSSDRGLYLLILSVNNK